MQVGLLPPAGILRTSRSIAHPRLSLVSLPVELEGVVGLSFFAGHFDSPKPPNASGAIKA
eukprot:853203-Amphidinium_carterae.1